MCILTSHTKPVNVSFHFFSHNLCSVYFLAESCKTSVITIQLAKVQKRPSEQGAWFHKNFTKANVTDNTWMVFLSQKHKPFWGGPAVLLFFFFMKASIGSSALSMFRSIWSKSSSSLYLASGLSASCRASAICCDWCSICFNLSMFNSYSKLHRRHWEESS